MEQASKTSLAALSGLLEQEEEGTQNYQLKCFFNYLLLGQWELAKGLANIISRSPVKEDVKQLFAALSDLASNPYGQR